MRAATAVEKKAGKHIESHFGSISIRWQRSKVEFGTCIARPCHPTVGCALRPTRVALFLRRNHFRHLLEPWAKEKPRRISACGTQSLPACVVVGSTNRLPMRRASRVMAVVVTISIVGIDEYGQRSHAFVRRPASLLGQQQAFHHPISLVLADSRNKSVSRADGRIGGI